MCQAISKVANSSINLYNAFILANQKTFRPKLLRRITVTVIKYDSIGHFVHYQFIRNTQFLYQEFYIAPTNLLLP